MSCQDCARWLTENGRIVERFKMRVRRPLQSPTPCGDCPKIPPGVPATPYHAVELDAKGWATWNHYRQCKAVGRFPEDAATEFMAGLLSRVEDQCAEAKEDTRFLQLSRALMAAATTKGMRGG